MKYIITLSIFVMLLVTCSFNTQSAEIKPFTSDGCSVFPDGTLMQKELWLGCCTAHDFAYWKGGTLIEKDASDIALKECVAALGKEDIGLIMLAGVRVGGSAYFPTSFRWGYGWPYPKPYGELTANEREQIKKSQQVNQ
ncbi:DUF3430 domain-containing protein [Shewanella donghaensis]|uniref:DUF3430 domain-containing protein n=1 Tax=Shewanella donghaensis TaxID=238836 RepID=UPI001D054864|nr:DUF3430 domain-containing protein [Shewanella donghaensis]